MTQQGRVLHSFLLLLLFLVVTQDAALPLVILEFFLQHILNAFLLLLWTSAKHVPLVECRLVERLRVMLLR